MDQGISERFDLLRRGTAAILEPRPDRDGEESQKKQSENPATNPPL